MAADVETVVIGAGVVGLAIARALTLCGREAMVLEQHGRVGMETSSRSSEVIHAGLYYPPGSLKAKLCVEGKTRLYRFCEENGVALRRTGKLIVATSAAELSKLEAIAATAARNGVTDLVPLEGDEARRLEPEIRCAAALLSPSTGVVDSHGLVSALEGHGAARGAAIVAKTRVTRIGRGARGDFEIETESAGEAARLTAKWLVVAAGLGATRLGKMLAAKPGYRVPETYPAKGHYFTLSRKAPFRHLVYPIPEGGGLGIHLTLDIAGQAKFGPDVEWKSEVDYGFEDADGSRLATFVRAVRRYWPDLPEGALEPGYTGVRPKIHRADEPPADFAIHGEREHGIARLVALYGIESPGLTCCLAIGEHVAAMVS